MKLPRVHSLIDSTWSTSPEELVLLKMREAEEQASETKKKWRNERQKMLTVRCMRTLVEFEQHVRVSSEQKVTRRLILKNIVLIFSIFLSVISDPKLVNTSIRFQEKKIWTPSHFQKPSKSSSKAEWQMLHSGTGHLNFEVTADRDLRQLTVKQLPP